MSSMRKQRAVYAAALSLVLAVTMAISLYTASSEENEDSGYTAEVPESYTVPETSVVEDVEIPETEEVQKDIVEPNEEIETADSERSVDADTPEKEVAEDSQDSSETASADMEAAAATEANGIFFDPATDSFAWPVSGNVVMEYSLDQVIYDATLDQFRVNDSISISAAEAEEVRAAAAGIVTEIGYSEEMGNYVVLEHGNGFRTTYGQMESDISLAVAERVEKGEVLGKLAEPVWYSVALGDHLDFKVTLDGEAVDPLEYLEYEME